jgi:hypothetical protein
MSILKTPKKNGAASKQIDLIDVNDGVLRFSANRYRLVLKTTSINFELKSEEERDAIIDIYEGFLNSISFPLQILIRTREIDIDEYLKRNDQKVINELITVYKNQLKQNSQFIKSLISENKILSRHFYIVIPYQTEKKIKFNIAREQLTLRASIITKNLNRLGINCHEFDSLEAIDLFYSFYNPISAKNQPLNHSIYDSTKSDFIRGGK